MIIIWFLLAHWRWWLYICITARFYFPNKRDHIPHCGSLFWKSAWKVILPTLRFRWTSITCYCKKAIFKIWSLLEWQFRTGKEVVGEKVGMGVGRERGIWLDGHGGEYMSVIDCFELTIALWRIITWFETHEWTIVVKRLIISSTLNSGWGTECMPAAFDNCFPLGCI